MKASVVKYWTYFLLQLKEITEYKLRFISLLFKPWFSIALVGILWYSIYQAIGTDSIAGFTFDELLLYYILVRFIGDIVNHWILSERMIEAIQSGSLLSYLCRPVDYLKLQIIELFPQSLVLGGYGIFSFYFIAYIFSQLFGTYFPSILESIAFLTSLFFGFFIMVLVSFILCCSVFWFGDTWSVMDILTVIKDFFSGKIIPLHISAPLLLVSSYLPFKYMSYTPAMIFMGRESLQFIPFILGLQIFWILALYTMARFIFNKGKTRFEAQGE